MTVRRWMPVALLGLLATCDTGPREGDIVLTLASPNVEDGAVAFVLTAVEPEVVLGLAAECAGCQVFTQRLSDAAVRGIVTGPVLPGPLVRVTVSNRKDADLYSATVLQVASRAFVVRNPTAYTLTPLND